MPTEPAPGSVPPAGPGDRCIVIGHEPALVHDLIAAGAEVHVIGPVRPDEIGYASHHAIDPSCAEPTEIVGVIQRVGAVLTRLYVVGVDPAPYRAAAQGLMPLGGVVQHDGHAELVAPAADEQR